jgi:hypothetical protein
MVLNPRQVYTVGQDRHKALSLQEIPIGLEKFIRMTQLSPNVCLFCCLLAILLDSMLHLSYEHSYHRKGVNDGCNSANGKDEDRYALLEQYIEPLWGVCCDGYRQGGLLGRNARDDGG